MQINNEQANALRSTSKELAMAMHQSDMKDVSLYEELTKVNNELTNLQREMARKNAELEKLNQQKSRFLGMAAHDLRTPLGIILSYADFLETEASAVLNEEHREFISTIKQTSEFMLNMVTDLLDVTAIESGQLVLNRRPTHLSDLVQRNVQMNGVLAVRKDISVHFEPGTSPCVVELDSGKIDQVLNNLISNALKFSHPGTVVDITMEPGDREVVVTVNDQGQGIPEADLPKLFKPFGRTSVNTTAGEQSTGLGLSIVRRIIEGHGGRIWVESKVGKGSAFHFTLPMPPRCKTPESN